MLTWMAYAALVGGIVAAAALALERLAAAAGRPRRIAWLAALTLAVLIPLTGGLRRPTAPVVVIAGEAPEISEPVTEARWTIVPQLPLPSGRDTTRTANVVWGAGSAAALAVLGTLLLVVARARRRWDRERVDGTDVYVSRRFGPALVGVTKPRVVLPRWVLGLEAVARAAIVRHELEHARARDHLALLYAGLVVAAFPWSPAIWWMCRRLRAAVEIDCDQRVIASGIGVADYGAVLLDAGSQSQARWGLALAMGQPRSLLERRLKTMSEKQGKLSRSQAVLLSGAALVALAIACDAPAPTQIEEAIDEAMESQAVESTGQDNGDSPIAGIIWEDPPVVSWEGLQLFNPWATVAYRNETSLEFGKKLAGILELHRADLRAKTIEVEADHLRLEGDRLIVRGGKIELVTSGTDDDSGKDRVLLIVREKIQQDSRGAHLFWFDPLGIAVPSSQSELIEDLDARWSSPKEGTG